MLSKPAVEECSLLFGFSQAVALKGSTAASVGEASGISGHGFLMASDIFTRQPFGPAIQPNRSD